MNVRIPRGAMVLAASAVLLSACGSNPPCETDIATVKAARSAAGTADARLTELESNRKTLAADLAKQEQERAALEARKAELAAKIAELEGGAKKSGGKK